jgi:hypothetical protein
MKMFFAAMLVTIALLVSATAQDTDNVGVRSNQHGSSVSFSVFNDTGATVCVFPVVEEANNVYGSVVPMIQLEAGEQNVNIGSYAQSNSNYAWSVRVGAKWRKGTCA